MTWQMFVLAIVGVVAWPACVLTVAILCSHSFERALRK